MNCPKCQTRTVSGQKFCGTCGHKLEATCVHCGAANPPDYQFCGQCGASLAMAGTVSLARSGLITQIDQKALDLLGYRNDEMQNKPFSLFVARVDMVIFFSHWNELLSQSKTQSFEIALKQKNGTTVFISLDGRVPSRSSGSAGDIQLIFNKGNVKRLVSDQMQYQQDMLNLIFSATDSISTVSKKHLDQSIEDTLKKICLLAKADRCFIYAVNRRLRCLELIYLWCQPSSTPLGDSAKLRCIPLKAIKRAIVKLRQEQAYIINDVNDLPPAERKELQAWHQIEQGAVMCHLIYTESGTPPVGVIGLARDNANGKWQPNNIALVKFFGQIASVRLPLLDRVKNSTTHPLSAPQNPPFPKKQSPIEPHDKVVTIDQKRSRSYLSTKQNTADAKRNRSARRSKYLPDKSRPMRIEKLEDPLQVDQQTVFTRDDGLVLLTCPRCGLQESIHLGKFDKFGNAISVICPCKKHFAAVLEKRHAFRKSVNLSGFFSIKSDLEKRDADESIWGPMVVKDISKLGLRFSSQQSNLVHSGDLLMVRFNLDNSNKALIHKAARVISTVDDEIGCQFEGADSYDITLGFYFI